MFMASTVRKVALIRLVAIVESIDMLNGIDEEVLFIQRSHSE